MSKKAFITFRYISYAIGLACVILCVVGFYFLYVALDDEVGMFLLNIAVAPALFDFGATCALLFVKEEKDA